MHSACLGITGGGKNFVQGACFVANESEKNCKQGDCFVDNSGGKDSMQFAYPMVAYDGAMDLI